MHRFLYNDIHVGDACVLIRRLPRYDVIFMGDIIEHLEKAVGCQLLRDALKKARRGLIVSTPRYETSQADLCGNELERHRSLWSAKDFNRFDRVVVKASEGEETTASGIVIPDTAKERPQEGEVMAAGPGRFEDGQRIPMDVKAGDAVIYSKYGGTEVKVQGQEYLILSARDVLAVISNGRESS